MRLVSAPNLCHSDRSGGICSSLNQHSALDRHSAVTLSSRPKWRDLQFSTSICFGWKRRPPLCHPDRSGGICSSLNQHLLWTKRRPPLCHPDRSGGICSSLNQHLLWTKRHPPLCHPDRTRISYHATPEMTSCAAFIKESRMNFVEPIALNRKSRGSGGICSSPWSSQRCSHFSLRTSVGCLPACFAPSDASVPPRFPAMQTRTTHCRCSSAGIGGRRVHT
jgi:hypothetical protein